MRRSKNGSRRVAANCAAFFLVVAVTIIPLSPAFAQSSDATATASSPAAPSGTTTPSSDTQTSATPATVSSPTTDTTQTSNTAPSSEPATTSAAPTVTSPTPAPAPTTPTTPTTPPTGSPKPGPAPLASSQAPIPANSQPAPYGSFNHTALKIDKNTGALTTEFPIDIPPGRNGLQPDVNLTYSSSDNQLRSIFGEGWSVNIPYIERLNKMGVDNLYSTTTPNYFRSSLDGELATTSVSGTYVPRTENGNFNKYVFSSNSWTMTDKNGTQYTFGTTMGSQQSDPSNTANVYKWMLKQVLDKNGNYITYGYFKDAGQIYPAAITYTWQSTSGIFEIDFLRTSSTDNATSSQTGFPVKSNYRVNEIDAKVNGTWVRKYALAYGTADNGSSTLLTSITESGQNASGTVVTLPAVTFSYQHATSGWTASSTFNSPVVFSSQGTDIGNRLVPVTGKELSDILSGYIDGSGVGHYEAYVNNNHGWTETSTWSATSSPFSNFGTDTGWRLADLDGNGQPDLILGYQDSGFNYSYDAYTNTGSGWLHNASWAPPAVFSHFGQDTGWRIADVNGDGLQIGRA